MKLSDILLLLKGKRAAVGEIRNWKGGSYIKTPTGWKPHEKQYSKKYTERKNNAATKKDSDLRSRQSEVARLSGEIQGHKAAVEHHTKQGTKQDERQAKHHAIRAQVKQRRLDKHKEILENRHGVKEEVVDLEKEHQDNYAKDNAKYNDIIKRIIQKSPAEHEKKFLAEAYDFVPDMNHIDRDYLLSIAKKYGVNTEPKKQTPVKSPEAKANFEKWKADRQEAKPKETAIEQLASSSKKEAREFVKQPKNREMMELESEIGRLKNNANFYAKRGKVTSADKKRQAEISKLEEQLAKMQQPKPKENVIQSGSRGATIAGQQYSKREVDILNSLDEIIGRAKSPVVQDLLKKRQAATIELPSKELGQPKLAAHESKFMELVKRNRSQADKQAGYPDERRKVEAETGVKIPREKAVEMTKHMKASFIWDIKKPLLIR